MIVTEEILAPYRRERGFLNIGTIPSNLFTFTSEAFRSDWPKLNESRGHAPEEALDIILVFAFSRHVPPLKPGRQWLALQHQCGGYSCEQQIMVATRLTPHPSILPSLRRIAGEGSGVPGFWRTDILASRIVNYAGALAQIGVDCECTWRHLTESLYPIDATDDNLSRVAEDALKLSDLSADYQPARFDHNPVIFFLTENSD